MKKIKLMKRVILNSIILLPTIGLVISCGNGNQKKETVTTKGKKETVTTKGKKETVTTKGKKETVTTKGKKETLTTEQKRRMAILADQAHSKYPKLIDVNGDIKKDGFYMFKKDYYNGILSNDTKFNKKENYISINQKVDWFSRISEIGDNDSICFLYNEDDTDGLKPSNFEETVVFIDSSIGQTQSIINYNNNLSSRLSSRLKNETNFKVKFKNGELVRYLGSQTSHTRESWTTRMQKLKDFYNENSKEYKIIKEYYEKNDPSYKPTFWVKSLITYKSINIGKVRGYKLTFHTDEEHSVTAACLGYIPNIVGGKLQQSTYLSIGTKTEWEYYEMVGETSYLARKNTFIKK